MQQLKVLITGATGFIGSFLVEKYIAEGYNVFAAVREGSNTDELNEINVTSIIFPYSDKTKIIKILNDYCFDYIIHNAGATKAKTLNGYIEANTKITANIVDAIIESKIDIKKFTFISSLAATGPADFQKKGVLDNDSTFNPVTGYGISKHKAELYIKSKTNFPYIIIRPTAVYGPKEKDLLSVFKMVNNHIEMFIGNSPQKLTFIYVKDLVDLIYTATTSLQKEKVYYATDGHVYSSEAFSGNIRELLDKWTIKIKIPVFIVNILAIFSETIANWKGNYSILNRDKVHELKAKNWVCDVKNHLLELTYTPKYDLRTGLKETINWYKTNGWL